LAFLQKGPSSCENQPAIHSYSKIIQV